MEIQWHAAFIKHQAPCLTHGCWGFKGLINNTPLRSSSAHIQLRNETLGPDQLRSGWAMASLWPCWWTAGLALQSTWGAHLSAPASILPITWSHRGAAHLRDCVGQQSSQTQPRAMERCSDISLSLVSNPPGTWSSPTPAPGPYYANQVSVSVILAWCVPDSEEEEKEEKKKKSSTYYKNKQGCIMRENETCAWILRIINKISNNFLDCCFFLSVPQMPQVTSSFTRDSLDKKFKMCWLYPFNHFLVVSNENQHLPSPLPTLLPRGHHFESFWCFPSNFKITCLDLHFLIFQFKCYLMNSDYGRGGLSTLKPPSTSPPLQMHTLFILPSR